jgi:hypothetical protein
MNWEAIGALGEIVGAMAVFLTLIYLAAQIRQNTRAVRASAVDAAVHHVSNVRQALFSDDELTGIYIQGNADPTSLDDKSLVRYRLLIHNILMGISNIHAQASLTGLSKSNWESQLPIVKRIVSTAGGTWFWTSFRHEFEESFRDEVDTLL